MKRHPEQVFFTPERKDLFQLLCNVDLYLNTYPISGGLMIQYAALAGKIPLTLWHDPDAEGMLIDWDKLGFIFYSYEAVKEELYKLVEDLDYKKRKESLLPNSVVSSELFRENLSYILNNHMSRYSTEINETDTRKLEYAMIRNFGERGVEAVVGSPCKYRLLGVVPFLYLKGLAVWFIKRIRKR